MPLEPATAAVLQMINSSGTPSLTAAGTPEQARAGFRFMTVDLRDPATLASVRSVEDTTCPGPVGDVPVRVYRPAAEGPVPTIVFLHGGGFVLGDLDTHDDHARLLCSEVEAVVVSVDYRLAPEHPFPAGFEDCLAAARWVGEHVAELGGDPGRLAIGGDSAGGNLSAAVCLAVRDGDGPRFAAQLLLYPGVDFTEGDAHASRLENAAGFFLTTEDMRWFGEQYLAEPSMRTDPRASVLHAPDLSGLPPAIVATAEYDPLRDEGEAYAAALRAGGVDVDLRRYDGLIHGFFGLGAVSPGSAHAVRELCAALKELLAR